MKPIIYILIILVLIFAIYSVTFGQTLTNVNIRGKVLTPVQYKTFKTNIIKKFEDKKNKPTYDDAMDWLAVANKEIKEKGCRLTGLTNENIVIKVNECIR